MALTTGVRALARQPLWRRWTMASFLARLPGTMTLLALVLVGERAAGSLATGAQLAGVATVVAGLAAPWRGRRLDRFEVRRGLQRATLATGAAIAAQAAALVATAPLWVFFALAALQGLAMAAVSGGFRALLVPVVPPEDLARANVVEAIFIEVAFVAGPALAGVLALLVGPVGVLLAMALSSAAAAWVTGGLPSLDPPPVRPLEAPWRVRAARIVYLFALSVGICFGILEAALPVRATDFGLDPGAAGFLLALIAAGSALGGLVASAQHDPMGDPARRGALLLGSFGVLLIAVSTTGWFPLLALGLFAAGVPIAPLNALGALLLQREVPPGRQAEGFAVYVAAILLGAGVGQAGAGTLLHVTSARALLIGVGGVPLATALLLVVARRRGRRRPEAVTAA